MKVSLSCLLVDDSEEFLASAERLLTLQGINVVGRASSSSQARRLAADLTPDVALVDVELGDEDGIELARLLAADATPTHVILISLRDRYELNELIAGAGVAGFLRKDALDAQAVIDLVGPRNGEEPDRRRVAPAASPKQENPAELRDQVESQGALRRVATLVAQGAEPNTVFTAVAVEASRLLNVEAVSLLSYDAETDLFTKIFGTHRRRSPESDGTTWRVEDCPEGALVLKTGGPVRIDDWTAIPGPMAARHREQGFGQAVAAPIIVDGKIWGHIAAYGKAAETLPQDCETRLADYTNLMATAISNVQARDDLRALADEQGALRRVATLVAQGAEPRTVFTAVAVEASRLLNVGAVSLISFDASTKLFTKIFGTHGRRAAVPDGGQWGLPDCPEGALILQTGGPVRIDDWTTIPGPVAARHRTEGFGQAVAAPVVVDGDIWGHIAAFGEADEILRAGSEIRLADFTNLMASAISNAQVRAELRGLAEQQGAALRRVATLVAQQVPPSTIFDAVAGEASRALGVRRVVVARADDGTVTLLGSTGTPTVPASHLFAFGHPGVITEVLATRRPARIDDWITLPGPVAEFARQHGFGSVVGAPIVVDSALWGVIVVIAAEMLPADTETRLTDFTHLVASSISNVKAREDLRRLADEQGALRRVATLVARGAEPDAVFTAVAEEAARVLGVRAVSLASYDATTEMFTEIYGTHGDRSAVPAGGQFALADCHEGALVVATGQPGRVDDWSDRPGPVAARHRESGFGQTVAAPIIVDGEIWGHIAAFAEADEMLPAGCETHLADFTQLVASSISNVHARNNLIASRARIVTASDETRRRIERNLHDGIQQRMVALGLRLRAARTGQSLPEVKTGLDQVTSDLEGVLEEIRIFSQGLHPALLSRSGLGPSLRTLARRSPIPVDLKLVNVPRFPEPVETAVYYVVSETLANAAKHSQARVVTVAVTADVARVKTSVSDDGIGGAALRRGSGLIGLVDRVEALGGKFALDSPPGQGTTIAIELPLGGAI
jgi:signal transduction histidine kinase/DNA-binding NarL/FixJ family response regulator